MNKAPIGRKTAKNQTRKPLSHVVVQEGGATGEMYVHLFDSERKAAAYRKDCDKASYNTSEPVPVPPALADLTQEQETALQDLLQAVAKAAYQVE